MASRFRSEDVRVNPGPSFWRICEYIPSIISVEGLVRMQKDKEVLGVRLISLAGSLLCIHTGVGCIGVDVSWKQTREFTQNDTYGVEISGAGSDLLELYFLSEKERWRDALRAVTLSTDFEENYEKIPGQYVTTRVFLARERKGHDVVAVKHYTLDEVSLPNKFQRLVREIDISRRMKHPNVGKLISVYETPSAIYLVYEYISGGNLLQLITTKGKLDEPSARAITCSLLHGVMHMHNSGVIHRDIKLENVMVSNGNTSVVVDFGLAIHVAEERGAVCGTPGYVAPEMLRKQHYGCQVDVYGVGVILYILLSGKSPFPGSSESAILASNKRAHISFASKVWEEVSSQARKLVLRMTEPDPLLRITAQQALQHPWFAS